MATLIAAAAVGTYVTIVGGQGNFASLADRTEWALTLFVALMTTLIMYMVVIASGMSTVFTTDDQQRHKRVKFAAQAFYVQGLTVIAFAIVLTSAVLTFEPDPPTSPGSTEPAQCCQKYCPPKWMTREDAHKRVPYFGGDQCR